MGTPIEQNQEIQRDKLRLYTDSAPPHSRINQQIVVSGMYKGQDMQPDLKAIQQKCYRLRKTEYPSLLWYAGVSHHKSDWVMRTKQRSNHQRGRPRIVIRGKKSVPHLHIFLMSEDPDGSESVANAKTDLKRFINKRTKRTGNLKELKSSEMLGAGFIKYIYRQSDHISCTSNYDFSYFLHSLYNDSHQHF